MPIVVVGDDQDAFDVAMTTVREELMPFERRALLTSTDEARDPRSLARSVIQAGLGAPDSFDEEFFARIRDAFSSPEMWVREAAVWATAYSPWPQYRPLPERTAHNDPEEKLRGDAETVLAGFDAERVEGP